MSPLNPPPSHPSEDPGQIEAKAAPPTKREGEWIDLSQGRPQPPPLRPLIRDPDGMFNVVALVAILAMALTLVGFIVGAVLLRGGALFGFGAAAAADIAGMVKVLRVMNERRRGRDDGDPHPDDDTSRGT